MAAYSDHFGINNIPFGIAGSAQHQPQCVSRIDNTVVFLAVLARAGLITTCETSLDHIFDAPTLNAFAALPKSVQRDVRSSLQQLFSAGTRDSLPDGSTTDIDSVQMHLPVAIGDFTDFSASKQHVLNAGEAVLGKRSLPPGFLHFPVGYAGRASSIVVSGTPVERPVGQFVDRSVDGQKVVCRPSEAVDYELEVAAIIGKPVEIGQRVRVADADEHIFGLVILNDWSARDIQALEMQPLGPLNSKNFGTSMSPWVITLDALAPFKTPPPPRDQPVASYLNDPTSSNYSIDLVAEILSGSTSTVTCRTQLQPMYWTFGHMLAHHTLGGCNLKTGDLIASGTVSGLAETEHGCLLELTRGGTESFRLEDGSSRTYLHDGDVVRFTGFATREGSSVGFGDCVGQVRPARPLAE
ncbi:hypothetical protein LTR66_000852 [Elasticomyces elasticus]|nr:hypothetical protein LTR28_005660 [Elasticomyces elasticus]KAK5000237.1 hypothetical protein LTR66_000852 [Elasticomyces elasticus]